MHPISRSTALRLARQSLVFVCLLLVSAPMAAEAGEKFKRIPTQYIAALGEPGATAGTGAETWALWRKDPGPRGVWFKRFDKLKSTGGVAPAKWTFDRNDWWLDENGLIMEKPDFSLPSGKYLVTGDRETISTLTVHPMDDAGAMRWELDFGATLYNVTHLPCRSARYRPTSAIAQCTPESVTKADFPVNPGSPMPVVSGCSKQDFSVLFVIAKGTIEKATPSAQAACRNYGQRFPGMRMLDMADGSLVLCREPGPATGTVQTPFVVRRADLRSLDDPSQRPRCKAKDRIEFLCGTRELCKLQVNNDLCASPDIAQYTTHAQVEWKCRADDNWRFNRVERGQELVIDCRQ